MQVIETPTSHQQARVGLFIVIAIYIVLALALLYGAPGGHASSSAPSACTPITEHAEVTVEQPYAYGRALPRWVAVRTITDHVAGFRTYRIFAVGQVVTVRGCRDDDRWGATTIWNVW